MWPADRQGRAGTLIADARRAIVELAALIQYCEVREREDAARAFRVALLESERKIERDPAAGLAVYFETSGVPGRL
jgi:hypothetical protein